MVTGDNSAQNKDSEEQSQNSFKAPLEKTMGVLQPPLFKDDVQNLDNIADYIYNLFENFFTSIKENNSLKTFLSRYVAEKWKRELSEKKYGKEETIYSPTPEEAGDHEHFFEKVSKKKGLVTLLEEEAKQGFEDIYLKTLFSQEEALHGQENNWETKLDYIKRLDSERISSLFKTLKIVSQKKWEEDYFGQFRNELVDFFGQEKIRLFLSLNVLRLANPLLINKISENLDLSDLYEDGPLRSFLEWLRTRINKLFAKKEDEERGEIINDEEARKLHSEVKGVLENIKEKREAFFSAFSSKDTVSHSSKPGPSEPSIIGSTTTQSVSKGRQPLSSYIGAGPVDRNALQVSPRRPSLVSNYPDLNQDYPLTTPSYGAPEHLVDYNIGHPIANPTHRLMNNYYNGYPLNPIHRVNPPPPYSQTNHSVGDNVAYSAASNSPHPSFAQGAYGSVIEPPPVFPACQGTEQVFEGVSDNNQSSGYSSSPLQLNRRKLFTNAYRREGITNARPNLETRPFNKGTAGETELPREGESGIFTPPGYRQGKRLSSALEYRGLSDKGEIIRRLAMELEESSKRYDDSEEDNGRLRKTIDRLKKELKNKDILLEEYEEEGKKDQQRRNSIFHKETAFNRQPRPSLQQLASNRNKSNSYYEDESNSDNEEDDVFGPEENKVCFDAHTFIELSKLRETNQDLRQKMGELEDEILRLERVCEKSRETSEATRKENEKLRLILKDQDSEIGRLATEKLEGERVVVLEMEEKIAELMKIAGAQSEEINSTARHKSLIQDLFTDLEHVLRLFGDHSFGMQVDSFAERWEENTEELREYSVNIEQFSRILRAMDQLKKAYDSKEKNLEQTTPGINLSTERNPRIIKPSEQSPNSVSHTSSNTSGTASDILNDSGSIFDDNTNTSHSPSTIESVLNPEVNESQTPPITPVASKPPPWNNTPRTAIPKATPSFINPSPSKKPEIRNFLGNSKEEESVSSVLRSSLFSALPFLLALSLLGFLIAGVFVLAERPKRAKTK